MITRSAHYGGSRALTLSGATTVVSFRAAALWTITPDTSGRVVKLTDASKLCETEGRPFALVNKGSDSIEVQDFDGNQLESALAQDEGLILFLADCRSSAGHWSYTKHSIGSVDNPALIALAYAFGGRIIAATTDDVLEWNPQLSTWTAKTPSAIHHDESSAFTVNAAGYTVGKRSFSSDTDNDRCDEYDPDVWTARTDMTQTRARHQASASTDGTDPYGVVFGGFAGGGAITDTPIHYDQAGNSWANGGDQPDGKINAIAWKATSTAISVAGGQTSDGPSGYLFTHESYAVDSETWTTKTSLDYPARADTTGMATGTHGYIIAGQDYATPTCATVHADNSEYDPSGDTFTAKTDLPNGRTESPGGAIVAGKVYVYGGRKHEECPSTDDARTDYCGEYDPDTEAWSTQQVMPAARENLCRSNATIQQ